ncbi:MAG: hypothetical protein JNM27_17110 [Leptospirales bacterium]|nr:hypothetical protein [Leptospirales bacterium]
MGAERFIALRSDVSPISGGNFVIRHPLNGRTHCIPPEQADILTVCSNLASLQQIKAALGQQGWESFDFLSGSIAELSALDLLWSESRILEPGDAAPSTVASTTIAFVTHNRSTLLARALESYLASAETVQRILVVDDSTDGIAAKENQEIVKGISNPRAIAQYFGPKQRTEFKTKLIQKGMDPDLVEFALGDSRNRGYAVGASRNATLLLAPGTLISCDDDSFLPGLRSEDSLVLRSGPHLNEIKLYSAEEALPHATVSIDIAKEHQSVIGLTYAEIRKSFSAASIDTITQDLLCAILSQGRVLASVAGSVGDAGADSAAFALGNPPAPGDEAFRREDVYRRRLIDRRMLRMPEGLVLTESPLFVAMNSALANHFPLPPFPPTGRNQDGVFGHVLRIVFPNSLIAHLPCAVSHEPEGERKWDAAALYSPKLRSAEVLLLCIQFFSSRIVSMDPLSRMKQLGQLLSSLGAEDANSFQSFVAERWLISLGQYIGYLESVLRQRGSRPAFWAEDVERRIQSFESTLATSDLQLPTAEDDRTNLAMYGKLLQAWPEIREIASG